MMANHIPAILKMEREKIAEEVKGKELGIVQDGTPFGGGTYMPYF